MDVNKEQIGGTHYKTKYEHWDYVLDVGLDYFGGQLTRYVSRWRKKDGVQDLRKALHYINKMIAVYDRLPKVARDAAEYIEVRRKTQEFAEANGLTDVERAICITVALWEELNDLEGVRETLERMIAGLSEDDINYAQRDRY